MKRPSGSHIIFASVFFLFTAIFTSCVSSNHIPIAETAVELSAYVPESFSWRPVEAGIERFDFSNKTVPVKYHVVKIDLDTPGLELVCFPDKSAVQKKYKQLPEKIPQPFIFTGMRTASFAKKYKCSVAVNATPFGGKTGKWNFAAKLGHTRMIVGIHRVDGITVSFPREQYSALAFSADKLTGRLRASVVFNQNEQSLTGFPHVFGGFFTVLKNGVKTEFKVDSANSRSGAGVSDNGRFLYILVVEGEVSRQSKGLSYPQCADIFKAMGCADALEFDGGSSSQLCISGKSVLSYPFTVVQANSFGFTVK